MTFTSLLRGSAGSKLARPAAAALGSAWARSASVSATVPETFVMVMGNGDFGRLGTGAGRSVDQPTRMILPSDDSPLSVTCGGGHTLVLLSSGAVLSCGLNDWGQLGLGAPGQESLLPSPVAGLPPDVLFVSAGNSHSAAVTASGRVFTWGRNDKGQCGLGPRAPSVVPLPTEVREIGDIVRVSAGASHTLAVAESGALYSWGEHALLGLGSEERWRWSFAAGEATPRLVRPLQGAKVVSASAGHQHSLVVDDAGALYSFGQSNFYQTGTGSDSPQLAPFELPEPRWVLSAAAGGLHSLAATRGSGSNVFAWGANTHGALGTDSGRGKGEASPRVPRNVRIAPPAGAAEGPEGPPLELVQVSAGWMHSAGVDRDGALWAWGWGGSAGTHMSDGGSSGGQLGHGDEWDYWQPHRVAALAGAAAVGLRVTKVSCGFNHTAVVVMREAKPGAGGRAR